MDNLEKGKLYIIATPIGNLEDITFRAINILKEADIVVSEDTRVTKRLFDRYEISKPMISYNSQNSDSKHREIAEELLKGKKIALVSDAGTPSISDPGSGLVHFIYENIKDKIDIVPIPGPSAFITALSVSPVSTNKFTFFGFIPHKKGRKTVFEEIGSLDHTAIFYESPHRIMKTLISLKEFPHKKVVVGRELTKIYEEIIVGSPDDVYEYFSKNTEKVRGEFVVIVSNKK